MNKLPSFTPQALYRLKKIVQRELRGQVLLFAFQESVKGVIKGVRSCFLPFMSNGLEFSHGGNQHESSLVSSEQDSVKK